uniref:30S ribosomal protein S31, mitochondrial n=2 Tax=Fagus sylvatica TaxID=28930 RepID=A0A2N9FND4_FAGSY
MAMMQWCGAVARRVMMTHRPASSSLTTPTPTSSSMGGRGGGGVVPIVCGRGDKKTKKGKRFKGSYGNARPKKEKKIERIKDRVEVPRSTPWPLPFKLI